MNPKAKEAYRSKVKKIRLSKNRFKTYDIALVVSYGILGMFAAGFLTNLFFGDFLHQIIELGTPLWGMALIGGVLLLSVMFFLISVFGFILKLNLALDKYIKAQK